MSAKAWLIAIVVALVAGLAIGRYSLPAKVVTEVKTVEAEKKSTQTDRDRKVETTITETKASDGTETKTTKIVDDSTTKRQTNTDTKTDTASRQETTSKGATLSLSALAGVNPFASIPTMRYGGHISREVLGPVTIGVWGFSDATFGLSVGLNF